MNIFENLQEVGLNAENSIVISSGVLSAYGIRKNNDIDVITDKATYDTLCGNSRFVKFESHGREVLTDELLEIGTSWGVLGKDQTLDDLSQKSVVIDNVRYISLVFLLKVKQSWVKNDDEVRQKDIDDVKLIQDYLDRQDG